MRYLTNNEMIAYIQARIDSQEIKGDESFCMRALVVTDLVDGDGEPNIGIFINSERDQVSDGLENNDDVTYHPDLLYVYAPGQVAEYLADCQYDDDEEEDEDLYDERDE